MQEGTYYKCRVVKNFEAKKQHGNDVVIKRYPKGSIVSVTPVDLATNQGTVLPAFQTKDGFLFPESALVIMDSGNSNSSTRSEDSFDEAEVIEPKKNTIPFNFKSPDFFKKKSKSSIHGAMAGAVVGLVYALYSGKNKFLFSAVGALGGGLLGNMYNQYLTEEK